MKAATTTSTPNPRLDDPQGITYSRRAARYLSRFSWYNPHRDDIYPSLDAGWSHYEHVTLARCYETDDPNHTFDNDFVKAPQSESKIPTRLYPLWDTPLKELADFGVSQRMFFSTLLVVAGIMFAAGLLNVPMMIYFWGYAEEGKDGVDYMGTSTIRGSALCDATEWVECASCNARPDEYPAYRLDGTNVRRNLCDFDHWLFPGLCSFFSSVLLLLLMGLAFWKQRAAEVVFDEEVQTASDYSIKVSNPPPDAIHPEEWRQFFNSYACDQGKGVVLVTIALNNAKLIQALIQRRQKQKDLAKLLPLGTDMDDRHGVLQFVLLSKPSWLSRLTCNLVVPSARKVWSDIQTLEDNIRQLSQEQYKPVAVFVTFETERAQRNALHALSTGQLHVWRNQLDPSKVEGDGILRVFEAIERRSIWSMTDGRESFHVNLASSGFLMFRNYQVLKVKEANEPSDVRWNDLQASHKQRLEYYVASTIGMMVFVMLSGFFIFRLVKRYPTIYATAFISLLNVTVPVICEQINDVEAHPTEHSCQTSLYIKITIFRWFNSAIALSLISSFVESISIEDEMESNQESLIYRVYPVILAELFIRPTAEMMDLEENFKKHFLAPRARDQEEMNANFSGGKFWLAERYTDISKVLFVALYFSSLLPEAFLLAAFALLIQFGVAKFAMLRLCAQPPDVGFHLSRLSRNYFNPLVLVMHVVMSAYWWSGYPYDNVCASDDGGYEYCNQNFWSAGVFPPLPRYQPEGAKWMSESQAKLTSLYSWTSVVVLLAGCFAFVQNVIIPKVRAIFESTYEPDGADQGIDFTSVMHLDEVHGYIPQVKVPGFVFPMLACDIRKINENLLGWKDGARGYNPYNLINDVQTITKSKSLHPIFSSIRQFDPQI